MTKKKLKENQTVVVHHGGKAVKGAVVNSPRAGKVTVRLPAEAADKEPQELIFAAEDLSDIGAVGRKYTAQGARATSPPKEYAAFIMHGNYTCIRVSVGTEFTKFIPMDSNGLAIERMTNEDFGRTYKQLEGYGLGTAVFHYLRAADKFGSAPKALEILLSLHQYITESETEALVAKLKKEKPSMSTAELRHFITHGLPKEQAEKMEKIGKGAMSIVAKHNPDSASAKLLAIEKKGGKKAVAAYLKQEAKEAKTGQATAPIKAALKTAVAKAAASKQPTGDTNMASKKAKPAAKKPAKAAAKTNGKANGKSKPSAAVRYAGLTIKVLKKEHGARDGTKRAKAMDILMASKTTDEALKKFERLEGVDSSFIRYAVENKIISVK